MNGGSATNSRVENQECKTVSGVGGGVMIRMDWRQEIGFAFISLCILMASAAKLDALLPVLQDPGLSGRAADISFVF